jgi:chromate transporter
MNRLFQLALTFFKLGALTFGGGIAMLPDIKRLAIHHHWIQPGDWEDIITLSQLTPGAIAVNCANIIGYRAAGKWGSLVAVLGMIIAPITIISLLAFVFESWLALPQVMKALQGMLLAVFILFTKSMIQLSRFAWQRPVWFALSALSFLLVWFEVLSPLQVTLLFAIVGAIWVKWMVRLSS